jgi:hypothetical protein
VPMHERQELPPDPVCSEFLYIESFAMDSSWLAFWIPAKRINPRAEREGLFVLPYACLC